MLNNLRNNADIAHIPRVRSSVFTTNIIFAVNHIEGTYQGEQLSRQGQPQPRGIFNLLADNADRGSFPIARLRKLCDTNRTET